MVYLLHFHSKLRHAQHYLGYAEDVEERLKRHRSGGGAKLIRALKDKGIDFELVRIWEGGRTLERKLKKQKNGPKLCPICRYNSKTGRKK